MNTSTTPPAEELRRLHAAATHGPWAVNPVVAQIDAFSTGEPTTLCQLAWPTDEHTEAETEANAALIVFLRNNVPLILAALSASAGEMTEAAEVAALREALEYARGGLNCAMQRFVKGAIGPNAGMVHGALQVVEAALARKTT